MEVHGPGMVRDEHGMLDEAGDSGNIRMDGFRGCQKTV